MSYNNGIAGSLLSTHHTRQTIRRWCLHTTSGVGYIIACCNALHVKFNLLCTKSVLAGKGFKIDVNKWTQTDQVEQMTDYFQKEENGQLITRLSIVRSQVLKNSFGTANVTDFKAAYYDDKESFEAAMKMAIGDHLTEANKLIINKWRDAAFPLNKDDGAVHKEALRAILFALAINDFINGVPWATVSQWVQKQWLMPAVHLAAHSAEIREHVGKSLRKFYAGIQQHNGAGKEISWQRVPAHRQG